MPSERMKFGIAAVVLLAGGGVLVMSYLKTRPPKMPAANTEHEITQEVLDTLDESRFVELEVDQRADVLGQIEASIISQARKIPRVRELGEPSMQDLAKAFTERVSSMYWPDFDRDFSASQKRGDPTPREDALERFEKRAAYLESQDWGPKVVLDDVRVSLIQIGADGELNVRREGFDAGFGVMTGQRTMNKFPVPDDPVEEGLVSVEIVMPMFQYEVRSESMKPAVVGYHFAWNARMRKWIPYESIVFKAAGQIFGAPSL